jgi:hypothetical protein
MEIHPIEPPREFEVGEGGIVISHVADVELAPDEQLTFTSLSGTELDVVRKSWGYYATSSLNSRLPAHGLRAALVLGENGKAFLHLVERGLEAEHGDYLARDGMRVLAWLDTDGAVEEVARRLDAGEAAG